MTDHNEITFDEAGAVVGHKAQEREASHELDSHLKLRLDLEAAQRALASAKTRLAQEMAHYLVERAQRWLRSCGCPNCVNWS